MAEAVERLERLLAEGKLSCPELYAKALVEQVQTLLNDAEVTGCKVAAWDQIQALVGSCFSMEGPVPTRLRGGASRKPIETWRCGC